MTYKLLEYLTYRGFSHISRRDMYKIIYRRNGLMYHAIFHTEEERNTFAMEIIEHFRKYIE